MTYLQDVMCEACGEPVETDENAHWGLDACDICGKQYCETCLVSFSPTICKGCDKFLDWHTDEEKRDMCNAGVGRKRSVNPRTSIPRTFLDRLLGRTRYHA